MKELRSTRLISRCLQDTPDNIQFKGCDARFSISSACPHNNCFAIGDAVLALDSLSGRGLSFALESARLAAIYAGFTGPHMPEAYERWAETESEPKRLTRY